MNREPKDISHEFRLFEDRANAYSPYTVTAKDKEGMLRVLRSMVAVVETQNKIRGNFMRGMGKASDLVPPAGEALIEITRNLHKSIDRVREVILAMPGEFAAEVVAILEGAELESSKEQVIG